MDAVEALLSRKSTPKLTEPGPNKAQLDIIFQAAVRAPDHGALRPWQFIVFEGEGRERLADILVEAMLAKDPEASEIAIEKTRSKPLRAPMIIAVIAKVTDHPKIPIIEQKISAGAAAQNIMIAAHALDLAGIWRTGAPCFDPYVREKLGAVGEDEIVGFLYLGTANGMPPLPEHDVSTFVRHWTGSQN